MSGHQAKNRPLLQRCAASQSGSDSRVQTNVESTSLFITRGGAISCQKVVNSSIIDE